MFLDSPVLVNKIFNIVSFHSAFEYQWDEKYSFDGERHDFWEAVFVLSGEVECTEDDHVYILRKNNIIFHAPMEFHKIKSASQTSPHLFILSFNVTGDMPDIIRHGVFTLSHDESVQYNKLFRSLYDMCISGDTSDLRSQAAVIGYTSFLLELAMHGEAESLFSSAPSTKIYHSAIRTMENGLYDNLTLVQIAEACHISVSYLKVIFNSYAGQSPKKYYAEMRYHAAMRLLQSGASVAEVSEKMNFSSPSYFSVFMKKFTGQPPAKYIKELYRNV